MRPNAELKKVVMLEEAREAIFQECARALPNETGGVIVGRVDGNTATVHHVVGPGPKAKHGRASFIRDGEYAQDQLNALYNASNFRHDYLGEWHSHTVDQGPSPRDAASTAEIAASSAYATGMPLLLLCVPQGSTWVLKVYQLKEEKLVSIAVEDT